MAETFRRTSDVAGRNDLCLCGSQMKFKMLRGGCFALTTRLQLLHLSWKAGNPYK